MTVALARVIRFIFMFLNSLIIFKILDMSSYHILYFNQAIAAIIKPPVQDVVQFLKEHIQHDIRSIAQSTGNSDDEAVQLIHLVLVGIVNNLSQLGGKLSCSTLLANTYGSKVMIHQKIENM